MGQYQTDIDASVDWSINTLPTLFATKDAHGWTRIPDAAGKYVGECLSYIKQEFHHRTGEAAPSAGGWAEGYLKLPPPLNKYFAVEGFDRHKEYPKGSWIFNTPTHHVAQYLAKAGTDVLIAEQNADPDGSGLHITTRSGARFDMIMVPHVDQSAPTPPSAPAPVLEPKPAPVALPYTINHIDPKQVRINKDTKKWGLNYDNWTAIETHPEGTAREGDIKTVQAILIHRLGGHYYLENPDVPSGYNTADCADYVPPPPVTKPPEAPMPIPTSKEPYKVVATLLSFTTSNNAINHTNAAGTVKPGTYFIFNDRKGLGGNILALNVTKTPGTAGSWINIADNVEQPPEPFVPAPEPAPVQPEPEVIEAETPDAQIETEAQIRMSIQWLRVDRGPVTCQILQNTIATDRVHGGKEINLTAGKTINAYATFEQGGRTWALFKLGNDDYFYHLYAVPVHGHDDLGPLLFDLYTVTDKVLYGLEWVYDKARKTIDGVFKLKHPTERK